MNAVCPSMWHWLWESRESCWWLSTVLEPNDSVSFKVRPSLWICPSKILVFCRACCHVGAQSNQSSKKVKDPYALGLHSCILQIHKGPERDRMVELSTLTNQSSSITDQRMLTVFVRRGRDLRNPFKRRRSRIGGKPLSIFWLKGGTFSMAPPFNSEHIFSDMAIELVDLWQLSIGFL